MTPSVQAAPRKPLTDKFRDLRCRTEAAISAMNAFNIPPDVQNMVLAKSDMLRPRRLLF